MESEITAHDLIAVGDLVLYFPGLLRGFHLVAILFPVTGMTLLPVYQNTFILALAQLPGYFSAAYLVEKWGRKNYPGFLPGCHGVFTFPVCGSHFDSGTGSHGHLDVVLCPGCLGRFVCLHARSVPDQYPRDRYGGGQRDDAHCRCNCADVGCAAAGRR